jgi:PKHD-type hydroxylase
MIEHQTIAEQKTPYGIYWEDFLNKNEIAQIHALAEKFEKTQGCVAADQNINLAARNSQITWIPATEDSDWLYNQLTLALTRINKEFYKFKLVGGSALQYTEYNADVNGHYDWHQDLMLIDNQYVRKLSVSILLSDTTEFKGGAFLSAADGVHQELEQAQGRMIVFPSWMPHKVMPVLKGKRISLVCWVHGEKFV